VLAIVLVVVSVLANFVKREARPDAADDADRTVMISASSAVRPRVRDIAATTSGNVGAAARAACMRGLDVLEEAEPASRERRHDVARKSRSPGAMGAVSRLQRSSGRKGRGIRATRFEVLTSRRSRPSLH
jgi:hypothetical protein